MKYLEHLVKKEIDAVRIDLEMPKLINDSILYIASQNHAVYLSKNKILSHYGKKGSNKYSPQLRAEFYGAKNYQVVYLAITTYEVPLFTTAITESTIPRRKLLFNLYKLL